ncbi:hypothetical protein SSABA_v1c01870 [Spiroplasma sabaudiense Ar-1343]|uniref:Transmembrane protein n=1 Tax=Spiroplasma sabaudiense Ar-1343 TaxID=1276257 RepID=W6AIR7_9MOLU|nr:hypothetical protein [Spiroplasma sabaudiense]AHI53599.1 hypothetical protein SSABA_v1c01870 [Spiroplasma sabaudiense Ar-1343]
MKVKYYKKARICNFVFIGIIAALYGFFGGYSAVLTIILLSYQSFWAGVTFTYFCFATGIAILLLVMPITIEIYLKKDIKNQNFPGHKNIAYMAMAFCPILGIITGIFILEGDKIIEGDNNPPVDNEAQTLN